ncbi:MAG: nuclear transport factor 2 family protein [Cyclobacteriaceae bacterium]
MMRPIVVWISILICFNCSSQKSNDAAEIEVKKIVNQFFESLHQQDTVLYKKILFLEGQILSINNTTESSSMSMRSFRDDMGAFNPNEMYEEIPLSYDIKIHKGIAMAWVPYEFKVNGVFTHCGIDIFTLTETNEGWKIINTSYTKYVDGCNELKR